MSFTICAFYEGVACNGLDNKAPLADIIYYEVSGDNAKFSGRKYISKVKPISAGVANMEELQLYKPTEASRIFSVYYAKDQTSQQLGSKDWLDANIPVAKGDTVQCKVNNSNNNQVDGCLFILSEMQGFEFKDTIDMSKHPNAKWDEWTATDALTGGVWTDASRTTGTTTKHTYDPEKRYKILGCMGHSATMYAFRFLITGRKERAGRDGADLPELSVPLYGDFGEFNGDNIPHLECLASGADGDVYISVLVEEIGKA